MEADVVCHRLTPEAAFLLKTVKRMLCLGYVLLRYVLIYNLEVSFDFYLTFLQLDVIKMFTVQSKLFFTLLSAIFFELPITPTLFRFPLKVRVIGSRLYFQAPATRSRID